MGNYRGVNLTDFSMIGWNHFSPSGLLGRLPGGGTHGRSAFSEFLSPLSRVVRRGLAAVRLVIEIEDSIAQSRAVILSTRDAIELLERLEGRQFSN